MAVLAERRREIVQKHHRHAKDTGSPEVQISLLTERIAEVAEHLKGHSKDHHSRRGLVMMVSNRNRLLRYLARTNVESYQALIQKLNLRK